MALRIIQIGVWNLLRVGTYAKVLFIPEFHNHELSAEKGDGSAAGVFQSLAW